LKKELLYLKEKRWKEVSKKVQESRNFCDLKKDPEYQISVDDFATIKNTNIQEVGIGSIVTIKEVT
jgi:transcription elongation factor GreA